MVDTPGRKPHWVVEMGESSHVYSCIVGCSYDTLKLWRGLAEERLDDNYKGQNGHLSLEWVQVEMISNPLGSLRLAIDINNVVNLVMAVAMLCKVVFDILADMPSGPFNQVILTLTIPLLLYRVGIIDIVKDQFQGGHQE